MKNIIGVKQNERTTLGINVQSIAYYKIDQTGGSVEIQFHNSQVHENLTGDAAIAFLRGIKKAKI